MTKLLGAKVMEMKKKWQGGWQEIWKGWTRKHGVVVLIGVVAGLSTMLILYWKKRERKEKKKSKRRRKKKLSPAQKKEAEKLSKIKSAAKPKEDSLRNDPVHIALKKSTMTKSTSTTAISSSTVSSTTSAPQSQNSSPNKKPNPQQPSPQPEPSPEPQHIEIPDQPQPSDPPFRLTPESPGGHLDLGKLERELLVQVKPQRQDQGFQTDESDFLDDISSHGELIQEESLGSFTFEKNIFAQLKEKNGDFDIPTNQQEPILLNTILRVSSNDRKSVIELKRPDPETYFTLSHLVLLNASKGKLYTFQEEVGDISQESPFIEFDSFVSPTFPSVVTFDSWKCCKHIVIEKERTEFEDQSNVLKSILFVGWTSGFYAVRCRVPQIKLKNELSVLDVSSEQGDPSSPLPVAVAPHTNSHETSVYVPLSARDLEFMQKFNQVDVNRDGELSPIEIQRYLRQQGDEFDLELIQRYVSKIDKNGSGRVTFEEFTQALQEIELEFSAHMEDEIMFTDDDDFLFSSDDGSGLESSPIKQLSADEEA